MPGIARKDGIDIVHSPDGKGENCASESIQATDKGSDNVFINTFGVVREGDKMKKHPQPGCEEHAPTLSTYSANVYVNGLRVGRLDDEYDGHVIKTASDNVIAN